MHPANNWKDKMSIKNLVGKIPEVKYPREELSIVDRIKWTAGVAVLFLVMGFVQLPLSSDTTPFFYMNTFYQTITMITLGIGPIVTAIFLLQILLRLNILRVDLGDSDDRKFFYGMQKILILSLAILGASAFVSGFHLAGSFIVFVFLVSILVLGALSLMYMDEIVVKWGLGSGLALFISVGVVKILLYRLFNPVADNFGNIQGIIPNFINRVVNWGIFDFPLLFPAITTAFMFVIIFIGFRKKNVFLISTETVSGKYSMKFFYVSTLALGYYAVTASIRMWSGFFGVDIFSPHLDMDFFQEVVYIVGYNLSLGELQGLFTSGWYMLLDLSVLIHLMVYSVAVILLSLVLGYISAKVAGLDMFYMRQSPGIKIMIADDKEQELRNKIRVMIIISSLSVGVLSLIGDLFGIILTFGGALITVGYLHRCYEEIRGPRKVCPNCGSLGIEWLLPSLWSMWECRNCGYRGAIVVDVEEKNTIT